MRVYPIECPLGRICKNYKSPSGVPTRVDLNQCELAVPRRKQFRSILRVLTLRPVGQAPGGRQHGNGLVHSGGLGAALAAVADRALFRHAAPLKQWSGRKIIDGLA